MNHVFFFKSFVPISYISNARLVVLLQVTKRKATYKPTYDSLRRSLEDMKSQCLRDGVTRVSMPRYVNSPTSASQHLPPSLALNCALFSCVSRSIGCGLDRLNWDRVSEILEQVFSGSDISITVYSLPERAETKVMNENRRR